jgi:hypothetical protein
MTTITVDTLGQIDLDVADLATLAQAAAADDPRLMAVGGGWLGAGTHPAQPYLSAMLGMHGVGNGTYDLGSVRYGYDDGTDIVRRFLDNVGQWRGENARAIKARLREIAKPATVKRTRARVGDHVRSIRGQRVYLVTEVLTGPTNRVDVIGVEDAQTGLPNAFRPDEVEILSAAFMREIAKATR